MINISIEYKKSSENMTIIMSNIFALKSKSREIKIASVNYRLLNTVPILCN